MMGFQIIITGKTYQNVTIVAERAKKYAKKMRRNYHTMKTRNVNGTWTKIVDVCGKAPTGPDLASWHLVMMAAVLDTDVSIRIN
jgi:hypothetical protein